MVLFCDRLVKYFTRNLLEIVVFLIGMIIQVCFTYQLLFLHQNESCKKMMQKYFVAKKFGNKSFEAPNNFEPYYFWFRTIQCLFSKCNFDKCVSYTENRALCTVFRVAYMENFRVLGGHNEIWCSNYKPKFKHVYGIQNLKSIFQNSIPFYIFNHF